MRLTRPLLLGALVLATISAADGKPLFELSFGESAKLDAAAWGEPAVVDGHACRRLARSGVVPVVAWWGEGLGPPRGASFRVEVSYQDVAAAPVRVETFAGLPGNRELHRFGGSADGAWKTALIPLPWDLVMRVPGTDRTDLVISVGDATAVPIA